MTPAPCTGAGMVSARRSETGVVPTPSAAARPKASRVATIWSIARIAKDVLELQRAEEGRQRHDGLAGRPGGELGHRPVGPVGAKKTDDPRQIVELLRHAGDTGCELSAREGGVVIRHHGAAVASAGPTAQDVQDLNHAPPPWRVCQRKHRQRRDGPHIRSAQARNSFPRRPDWPPASGQRRRAAPAADSMRSRRTLSGAVAVKKAHSKPAASPQAMILRRKGPTVWGARLASEVTSKIFSRRDRVAPQRRQHGVHRRVQIALREKPVGGKAQAGGAKERAAVADHGDEGRRERP